MSREYLFSEVCDQIRLKPACSASETSYSLEILDSASIDIILSRQCTTKTLIILHRCAGWSVSLLVGYGINRFCHDMAQMCMHDHSIPEIWFCCSVSKASLKFDKSYVWTVRVLAKLQRLAWAFAVRLCDKYSLRGYSQCLFSLIGI